MWYLPPKTLQHQPTGDRPIRQSQACGGDPRETVKALIVANQFVETELEKLRAAVWTGCARGKLSEAGKRVPRDRKDWYA
jgi:hypothetical protein